jgi:16S rRNA (guanine527-N7)-methyltransferase
LKQASRSGEATDAELHERVASGAEALGLHLSETRRATLVAYVRLIQQWNETYNLTAVRDPADMVTLHILDSLAGAVALLRHREGHDAKALLDVGSGGGLPGIVIATVMPDLKVMCVDSVGKKAAFLRHAAASLALTNVEALHARVEKLEGRRFDVIASRAFASLADFVALTKHLLAPHGVWMAMKGKPPEQEIRQLTGLEFHVEPLQVPGSTAERCIVWLRPSLESVRTLPRNEPG